MKKLFSLFSSFAAKLFKSARPGLEAFLVEYLSQVEEAVARYLVEHGDEAMHTVKQALFPYLKSALPVVPDTWISIAFDIAAERIKAKVLDKAREEYQ